MYENTTKKQPRTSNNLEGWHGSLNENVSYKNSSLVELIQLLQTEQNIGEIGLTQSLYKEV